MRKLKLSNLLILLPFIWNGCASIATPTGGEKDIEQPQIQQTIPLEKSINYNGKIIEFIFNENIAVENLKQELLITPGIEGDYTYELKKNRISLTFDQPFQPHTTYTLNFRNAIKDITEKNIAENTKIVFSTGSIIDSLYIKGNVKDLLTNVPEENIKVMLYKGTDTSDIINDKPYYLTKTDKNGDYLLENLKKDQYKIYALSEKNNNLKYDHPKEKIAFLQEQVLLDSNYRSLNLKISSIDKEDPRIVRASADREYFNIELNEGIVSAEVKSLDSTNKLIYQILENKQIRLYNKDKTFDSIPVIVTAEDSSGNKLKEQLTIQFKEPKNATNENFIIETLPKEREKIVRMLEYKIIFNKPVSNQFLNKIILLADTITPLPLDTLIDITWNKYKTELNIIKKINANKNLRVQIPEETFFSIEGDTSKKITSTHEFKDISEYGTISGNINTSEPNFIIQLMNASYKVVAEQLNKKSYKFDYVEPGKYFIRAIIDQNSNRKWDPGNFEEKILPEKIIYYDAQIELKQNWDYTDNDFSI